MKQFQFVILAILFPVLIHAQWVTQATGLPSNRGLFDISVADGNTVWGIAYDGNGGISNSVPEFTKTTNGGNLFTPGILPVGYYWNNISAIDGNTAWVSAIHDTTVSDGAILKTTDGGATWNEQGAEMIFGVNSYANLVHFWNANEGVAVGDPNPNDFEIYTTSDGGLTWTAVPGSDIPDPVSPAEYGVFKNYCTIGNDIWFGTNNARLFHSNDKGSTWSVSSTTIPTSSPADYVDFAFWNTNEGIARKYDEASQTNSHVVRTADGGATWNPVTVSGTFFGSGFVGISYVPGTISTLVSAGPTFPVAGTSYSNDGGLTWTTIDTLVQHYVTKFFNSTRGWSAGFSQNSTTGGIYKYSGLPLGIYNPENGKEIYFGLYPNPSEGNITIQLNHAGNSNMRISVYNLVGKKVFENDFGKPGEFFMRTLDLSGLSSGVYPYEIINANGIISSGRIIRE